MGALLFCVALFAYWSAIGYALLALVPARIGPRQRALVSPALGAALLIVPIFWLNHLGLGVRSFGAAVLAGAAIAAAVVLIRKRPAYPWRRMLPFFAVLAAAFLLAAWPMLVYSFDWVSYGNSDMTHYSLGAARVLQGGFFALPDQDAVLNGTDYTVFDAYKYLLFDARAGSELMLAALWAATGLNAHFIFMPVIVALHLALISAAAAMVAGPGFPRRAPLFAGALLALSPLTTLGAMYQLIAQVGGLAFFCASVAVLYRIPRKAPLRSALVGSIPAVVSMAGLFIWYPELIPFLGLGWFAFLALVVLRRARGAGRVFLHALLAGFVLLALLNVYFVGAIKFMLGQAQTSGVDASVLQGSDLAVSAFPYFLVPAGIPVFWGLIPISGLDVSSYLTAAFFLGVAISLWFLAIAWRAGQRASPALAVFAVMALLAIVLFKGNKDFGLFKLAMYAQPFVLAVVAERLAALGPGWISRGIAVIVVAVASLGALSSQYAYVRVSTGEYLGGLSEIWHGSAAKVNTRFEQVVATLKEKSPAGYTSDTSSVVHLQHQTLYSRGYSAFYPAAGEYGLEDVARYTHVGPQLPDTYKISLSGKETLFFLHKNLKEELARRWLVTIPRSQTIFNRWSARAAPPDYYQVLSPAQVANHLVFMPSNLGANYYGFSGGVPTSFNHLESDPLFAGQEFSGLGRDLLFMVMNPSPKPRVLMEITTTVMSQFDNVLPRPTIHAEARESLGFVGRGSGRVVSAPIEPGYVEDVPFIEIDLGRKPRLAPHQATGVMALYGRDINPDLRYLTAYAREISLLSEAQYAALAPPAELRQFPADLGNPNLEYSGIYEDGWISEQAFFVLGGDASADRIRVDGLVPGIGDMGFKTTLTLRADGGPEVARELPIGAFTVEVPLPKPGAGRHRVDIHFGKTQRLPGGDNRVIGAQISRIGLAAKP